MGGSLRHTAELPETRRVGGPSHVAAARRLRNDAAANERRFWRWFRTFRRQYGLHVRRQAPIGPYVADFACHAAKLLIELDGPFHDPEKDRERDAWFAEAGYRTLRFSNEMLSRQWDRVCAEVEQALGLGKRLDGPLARLQTPAPNPSPQGGGEAGRRPPHEGEGWGGER